MDNGYFKCGTWWENTDTQAVMCIGEKKDIPYTDKEIVKVALKVMEPREEFTYVKGIGAYQAWKDMLLQEKWFENGSTFDHLFSKLLVQNDAMICLHDGRKWAAKYFKELANQYENSEKNFGNRLIREKLGKFIDAAGKEDTQAYEKMKLFYNRM